MNFTQKPKVAKKATRAFYKAKYLEISKSLETMTDSYLTIIGGAYEESIKNYQIAQKLAPRTTAHENYSLEA